jgi:hypothetical protein
MTGDRVDVHYEWKFIRWDWAFKAKFVIGLCFLLLTGCGDFPEWKDSVMAPVVKCVRVDDHYETTYRVKIDDKRTYETTFDTNIWMRPGNYETKIYWRFPKDDVKPRFAISGVLAYEKHHIDAGDKIYEATVIKVIETARCWVARVQWTEDNGKSYEASFEVRTNLFEGNKVLVASDGKGCNLVAWHMKYVEPSSSDDTMIFTMMGAM